MTVYEHIVAVWSEERSVPFDHPVLFSNMVNAVWADTLWSSLHTRSEIARAMHVPTGHKETI